MIEKVYVFRANVCRVCRAATQIRGQTLPRENCCPNGTKEQILTLVAEEPKTISQLAQALNLSAPSVYTHINDMLESELLRESEEFEKKHPSERYYEPSFPVFKREDCAEFQDLCDEIAATARYSL